MVGISDIITKVAREPGNSEIWTMQKIRAIAIHGGAGTIDRAQMSPEREMEYRNALQQALNEGCMILDKGGSSLDAVCASVVFMEENPLFNAGRGSVFNHEGKHEMDASVMRGDSLEAGAVAGICGPRNPVLLAREVMENSGHVLLCGKGAEQFARTMGLEFMPEEWFSTEFRKKQLEEALKEDDFRLDHGGGKKFGTVGAVALDTMGNLAAATSTGGMTNKKFGRLGDSPIIGSGNYADNRTCAVSCTGSGEYFIRAVAAFRLASLMEYGEKPLSEAADYVVNKKLAEMGGDGGLVAVDSKGNIAMPFNTPGMYRACRKPNGEIEIRIWKD